jgi:hypothetical protein
MASAAVTGQQLPVSMPTPPASSPEVTVDGPTFHLSPSAAPAAQGLSSASPREVNHTTPQKQLVGGGSSHQRANSVAVQSSSAIANTAGSLQVQSPTNHPNHHLSASVGESVKSPRLSIAPTSSSNAVLHRGVLTKLGGRILGAWRSRYFVLRENEFTYYENMAEWQTGKQALGKLRVDSTLRCWSESASDLEWKFICMDKTVVVRGTLQDKKESASASFYTHSDIVGWIVL